VAATVSWRTRAIAFAAVVVVRLLRVSVRLRHHGDGELRRRERAGQRVIIAFWHRHLLLMRYAYRGERISILISRHRDGELIARVMESFGLGTTRGSSTRGGVAAVRALLRRVREGYDLAVTPDGPRGPVGEVKLGVIQLAALSGVPIQPVALAASRCRRLASWDRFLVPLPFCRVEMVYGEMLSVPRGADLEATAGELARRLDGAEAEAERLAAGRAPRPAPKGAADA
jgi:lysophospholipid acyltransferase (LPLAT)-like uncharacterized protein